MNDSTTKQTSTSKPRAMSPTTSATAMAARASGPASAAPGSTPTARASTSRLKPCLSTDASAFASLRNQGVHA